jgi:hypothetical protein
MDSRGSKGSGMGKNREISDGSKFAIRTGTFVDSKGFKHGSNISGLRLEKRQIFWLRAVVREAARSGTALCPWVSGASCWYGA